MFKKHSVLVFVLGMLLSSTALALSNENFRVTQVDVTETQGIVWVHTSSTKEIKDRPTCDGKNFGAMVCDITKDYCKSVMAMALTAYTTDKEVDFQYKGNGHCIGVFAITNRFRLSN